MRSRRVLVVRFGSVGDIVLTGGAVAAMRSAWPDTRVCFVTRRRFAQLAACLPGVDEVVALEEGEGVRSLARRAAVGGVDAVLDLHTTLRSLLLRLWLPRARVGRWLRRSRWADLLVRLGLRRVDNPVTVAERYHRAVEELVGGSLPRGRLGLLVHPPARDAVAALLSAKGVEAGARSVALIPGANWATKRWAPERFAVLARRAIAQGMVPLVVGGPGEEELTRAVCAAAPGAVDLGASVSLAELPALIGGCAAVVAHDSGPMHMARALQVPTLAIFGSTDPAAFDFRGHAVHAAPPPCAPCHPYGRPACPRGHMACLTELKAEPAELLLDGLLRGDRPEALQA